MFLEEFLRQKGRLVHSIEPQASLDDVVQKLVRHNCGSLVVCDPGDGPDCTRMAGIITERDILRACAARRGPLDQIRVADVMTTKVVTGSPNCSLEEVMGLMTVNRVRHLPILDEERLLGIISIGDIVKAQHDQFAVENHYLKTYIQS